MADIQPGTTVTIAGDILANGVLTFARGEQVTIQQVSPNPQMPQYKYTVQSARTGRWYQLRDEDIIATAPQPAPQAQSSATPPPQQQYAPQVGSPGTGPAAHPSGGHVDFSDMTKADWLVAIGGAIMFISAFLYFGYVGFFFPFFGLGMVVLVLLDRVWKVPAIANWRGLSILFIVIGAIGAFFGIIGVLSVLFWTTRTVLGVRLGLPVYWYVGALLDLAANAAVLVGGIMRYREER